MHQIPGFVISVLAISAIWAVGSKHRVGWLFAASTEIPWALYSIWLKQYGLLLACVAWAGVYVRNYLHWRPHE
ncbi:MAG: hypothetical protein ABSB99_04320 [Acidimicrobiales bacterium]|jgi:hypothetical protein